MPTSTPRETFRFRDFELDVADITISWHRVNRRRCIGKVRDYRRK